MTDDFRKKIDIMTDKITEAATQSSLYGKHFSKYTRQKTRIKEAMKNEEQGKFMTACSNGDSACGSIFCDKCLDKRQRNMLSTYRKYIAETFLGDEELVRNRLRWVTVLHNVVKVNVSTIDAEKNTIKECLVSANELKNKIKNVSRNSQRIWMRGAIHAELVDYSLYEEYKKTGGATNKIHTISDFIDANGYNQHNSQYTDTIFDSISGDKELYFLIHFHALADIGDYTDTEFRKKLTNKWKITKRQVDVGSIWDVIETKNGTKKHTLEDAIKGMSRYCYTRSNAGLTFSKNWGNGEKVMSSKKEYDWDKKKVMTYSKEMMDRDLDEDIRLSTGELRLLILVHDAISGTNNDGLNVSIYKKL